MFCHQQTNGQACGQMQTLCKIVKNSSWFFQNILGIGHKKLTQENTKVNIFGQILIKFTEAEKEVIAHQEWLYEI